jgi:hypothetical protein
MILSQRVCRVALVCCLGVFVEVLGCSSEMAQSTGEGVETNGADAALEDDTDPVGELNNRPVEAPPSVPDASTSVPANDGGSPPKQPFGAPCAKDKECSTGACYVPPGQGGGGQGNGQGNGGGAGSGDAGVGDAGGGGAASAPGYCTYRCNRNSQCKSPPTSGQCNSRGYCRKP